MTESAIIEGLDLGKVVASIQSSAALNLLLWLASMVGGAGMLTWVIFGGPEATATPRAEAVERLWPIALAWFTALSAKSKITGDQKREVVRASAVAKLKPPVTINNVAPVKDAPDA